MKVLYISPIPVVGPTGACEHVFSIVTRLARRNNVSLIAPTVPASPRILSPNVLLFPIGSGVPAGKVRVLRDIFTRLGQLSRVLARVAPDVAYLRYNYTDFGVAKLLRDHGVPYVVEVNSNLSDELLASGKRLAWLAHKIVEPRTIRHADGVLSISEEINCLLRTKYPETEALFDVARNGVDTQVVMPRLELRTRVRRESRLPETSPVMCFIGTVSVWHGLDLLLDALQHDCLRSFYLWIIGSVNVEWLDRLRHHPAWSRVRTTEWVPEEQLAGLVSAADMGVGSLGLSRNQMTQGQPLKTALYLACGCPVIYGYDDPRLRQAPDTFARRTKATSAQALAEDIAEWWGEINSNTLVRKAARAYAEQFLSWDTASAELERFLHSVVARNRRAL